MTHEDDGLETKIIDLTGISLVQLEASHPPALAAAIKHLLDRLDDTQASLNSFNANI